MTEEEWLTGTDSPLLLDFLYGKVSDRKVRLFLCACCRTVWDNRWPVSSRRAVEAGERFADGLISAQRMNLAQSNAIAVEAKARLGERHGFGLPVRGGAYEQRLKLAARCVWPQIQIRQYDFAMDLETLSSDHELRPLSPCLVRDIFGNPFRPVAFDPHWRTETAVALAAGIYEERAFDRLPILADALEEAGCDHADVLIHCRGPGPHARGCWVVDGVLGKE